MIFSEFSLEIALKLLGSVVIVYVAVKIFLTAWDFFTWDNADYRRYRNIYGQTWRERLHRVVTAEGLKYELNYHRSSGVKARRVGERTTLVRTSRPLV